MILNTFRLDCCIYLCRSINNTINILLLLSCHYKTNFDTICIYYLHFYDYDYTDTDDRLKNVVGVVNGFASLFFTFIFTFIFDKMN
jgi:hypothetical protein